MYSSRSAKRILAVLLTVMLCLQYGGFYAFAASAEDGELCQETGGDALPGMSLEDDETPQATSEGDSSTVPPEDERSHETNEDDLSDISPEDDEAPQVTSEGDSSTVPPEDERSHETNEDDLSDISPEDDEAPQETSEEDSSTVLPEDELSPEASEGALFVPRMEPAVLSLEEIRICYTADELWWLLFADEGGEIWLGDDLIIDHEMWIWVENPVAVYMGEYSIYIPESSNFSISGPVTFVCDQLGFLVENASFNIDNLVEIEVRGDGACGIAFIGYEQYIDNQMDFAHMTVTGQDAMGIYSGSNIRLRQYSIDVTGEGAVGVRCEGQVSLGSVQIRCEGGGAAVDAQDGCVSYFSALYPAPDNIIIPVGEIQAEPTRSAVYVDFAYDTYLFFMDRWLYQAIYPIEECPDAAWLLDEGSEHETFSAYFWADILWDYGALDPDDPSQPGTYIVKGTLVHEFPIPDFEFPELINEVTVVPLGQPYISTTAVSADEADFIANLIMLVPPLGAEEILVWGKKKGEDTWQELTQSGQAHLSEDASEYWCGFEVDQVEENATYFFYLEVIGGEFSGKSNEVKMFITLKPGEGDRDLGDRDPEENQPDPPSNNNSTNTNRDTSDSGSDSEREIAEQPLPLSPVATAAPEEAADVPVVTATTVPEAEFTVAVRPTIVSQPPVVLPGLTFARQSLLDLIAANPRTVPIFCGDMRILFSGNLLQTLLGDAASMNIEAQYADGNHLLLRMWIGAAEILQIEGGVEASFPYQSGEGEGDYYLLKNGVRVPAQLQNGVLTAVLTDLGEYEIVFEAAVQPVATLPPDLPDIPADVPAVPANEDAAGAGSFPVGGAIAAGSIAVLGIGGFLIYRRRYRKP